MMYLCDKCQEWKDDDWDFGTEYGDEFICEECLSAVEDYEQPSPKGDV